MMTKKFNEKVQRVIRLSFNNDPIIFEKSLWRLTNGCHEFSFEITKNLCLRYGFLIDEDIFDMACANITGGCEVEWESLETPENIKQSRDYQSMIQETEQMKQAL